MVSSGAVGGAGGTGGSSRDFRRSWATLGHPRSISLTAIWQVEHLQASQWAPCAQAMHPFDDLPAASLEALTVAFLVVVTHSFPLLLSRVTPQQQGKLMVLG